MFKIGIQTDVFKVIRGRRSIRQFKDRPVNRETIIKLIEHSIQAPSGKNKQPWRFIVLEKESKEELVEIFQTVVQKLKKQGVDTGSSEWTINSIRQAPVLLLVYNSRHRYGNDVDEYERYTWSVDIQSIGGAIQTMLLAANGMGLGTLWVCDIFFADCEVSDWLGRDDELVAAVAVGYPDETPNPRPRLGWQEVTEWAD